ncbi:MAG: ribonuclease HII [Acidaminococcaceae bacterium]|nr:ribonuclease HII [Acidaminococcaceae bacterium]
MNMKLQEIKSILAGKPTAEELQEIRQDGRAGVQKLIAAYDKRLEKEKAERLRFENMLRFEKEYLALSGIARIIGVDEAGRGPLAGPLVIAGVILPEDVFIAGLNDSKKLSEAKREALYPEILEKAVAVLVNVVSISNIDTQNIYHATQEGMEQILRQIAVRPQVALVDAMHPQVEGIETVPIIHGDALSASIAAASVVAKVTRDRLMQQLAQVYPQYGLAQNKGYGSQLHMDAIRQFGATKIHRRSYEPIRSMNLPPVEERDNYLFVPENGKEDVGLAALIRDLEA